MLSTNHLGKSYGARTLFSDVSLKLNTGSRYGLVGANGSGKTTFLNVVSGDDTPTEGAVIIPRHARVGVLRQDRFLNDDELIVEVAAQGDAVTWAALTEQREIEEGRGDPTRAGDIDELIRARDGYTLEARASQVLAGLGIPVAVHRSPLSVLSGGFKLRVLLAQALLGGADILLLDEPTNHLDILSIRWLEKFLASYRGCAVVISHDQRFLDNVATHILDVDYGTVTVYTGNYSSFARDKAAEHARIEAGIANAEAAIAHKRAYIERFRYKASKAAQAQSALKKIEKIVVDELPESSRREPQFSFVAARQSGRDVLTMEHVSKSYGDKAVLRDVSLTVRRGEKLGIIGPNGLGKSTLLRAMVGSIALDSGSSRWGHEVRVGYFAQDHREVLLDPELRAVDVIQAAQPDATVGLVRSTLGRVLFSGDDAFKKVAALSGGEAARLVFGKLMIDQPNVLVLDEPTNHLDLESIDALVKALQAYEGTILFVSHDRRFVSDVATRIFELTPDGPRDFPGTYDEYLERCGDDHLDASSVVLRAKREKAAREPEPPAPPVATLSKDEQKKRRNRAMQLTAKRDRALVAVESAEKRMAEIQGRYTGERFFERTPKTELDALAAEEAALGPKIAALMAEWEALEAECVALAAEAGGP